MTITDLYRQLFGKGAIQDGNVIDMAEHGRVGDLSTGQGLKYVTPIDPDTGDTLTGAGTQYTEGDTDASITGTAVMVEGAANTLVPAQGTVADGLLVNLGSNNDVTVSGVATAANQLPDGHNVTVDNSTGGAAVNIQDGGNTITVDGTVAVTQSGTWDEVGINDSGNSITVDNAQLSVVGSGTEATAMRVTIATDSTGVVSVDDNGGNLSIDDGGNTITVDGTVAVTNAGLTELAAAINSDKVDVNIVSSDVATGGTSAADDDDFTDGTTPGTPAMGVFEGTPSTVTDGDLGVVGITTDRRMKVLADLGATDNAVLDAIAASVADVDTNTDGIEALLTTIDGDTSNLSVVGGGTEAAAIRVTVANNSTGVLSVDDNGGNISIDDGGNVITVDGSVTVDMGANNDVTVTSGAITETNSGTINTAVQLIDDAIFVDDADWTADTSKHALVGAITQVATTANTDGDTTPLTTNAHRELRVAFPESDLPTAGTAHVKKYYTSTGAATDGIIWSPAAGKRWFVTDIFLQVSAAATVTLEDDLAGGDAAIWKAELAANSGWSHSFNTPWFSGEDAADLIITTTAGNVYVTVTGYEI